MSTFSPNPESPIRKLHRVWWLYFPWPIRRDVLVSSGLTDIPDTLPDHSTERQYLGTLERSSRLVILWENLSRFFPESASPDDKENPFAGQIGLVTCLDSTKSHTREWCSYCKSFERLNPKCLFPGHWQGL